MEEETAKETSRFYRISRQRRGRKRRIIKEEY
jgi:hypothetical protein